MSVFRKENALPPKLGSAEQVMNGVEGAAGGLEVVNTQNLGQTWMGTLSI